MLISLIVTLIILGLLLWAVEQLPLDATIVRIIRVVIIIAAVLYLIRSVGYGSSLHL